MSEAELAFLDAQWDIFAHDHQRPPELAPNGEPWLTWLLIGGRGAGKTRAGAEWIRCQALGLPPFATQPVERIALVGESEHDVREVMIEGVSGLLAVHMAQERPAWLPSRKRLEWPNGAVAQAFSADDPESLRGPQFGCAWSDEMAKWRYAEAAFDMLQFGLRLGPQPRQLITTTPRSTALLKRLIDDPTSVTTRASTRANALNLAPTFLQGVMARYQGTRLGRQELDGEIIEDRPDALWSRALLEQCRVEAAPALRRIVVAVDPPVSSGKRADCCGIVAAGICAAGIVYVLADDSVAAATPSLWANKAIALWRRLEADALVVEVNQGGEMVRAVIGEVDQAVPVTPVRAHRGKWLRAEPVAMLYEQGRVKHAGLFAALEDEMCDFASTGLSGGRSPDRLDALVWAVASLALAPRGDGPRIRSL
ncbi:MULTISPECIES: terminase family protein [Rhodopseudomonas]|uniref:ATP-binding protein n=1 Tax=Rhodopseudomonas palustris TaxID=1076 RepID=A0A0D7EQ51_RHOPL|nr:MULTISPECIES: terminase family protein [Rhodopseudomonas]KIZ41592.1 ATP-binding protein [Rhodopseudomonas palustris]MDF3810368.1 terminase family protein [Rhodopseudomonas sp. BAL398]WOK20670.1 terminase family protein [Rhodopseudomonas sp. BAL398]